MTRLVIEGISGTRAFSDSKLLGLDVRDPAEVGHPDELGFELRRGDVRDPALVETLRGFGATHVVHLASVLVASRDRARDFDIDAPVKLLQQIWADAGRTGAPQIVALDFKPVAEKLDHWARIGVTEVLFGLPDKTADEVAAYVERLAGKLAAMT